MNEQIELNEMIARMRRAGARANDAALADFARRAIAAHEDYLRASGAEEDPDAYDEDDACEAILLALEGEDETEPDEAAMRERLLLLDAFMEALAQDGLADG